MMRRKTSKLNVSAIDLFCGAGGLTRGLLDAGINVVSGYDIDEECRFPFEFNNAGAKFIQGDLSEFQLDEFKNAYPSDGFKVLVGCAPCQPFSTYSRNHRRHSSDQRWELLRTFSCIGLHLLPDVISMENVPQIVQHPVYNEFCENLASAGYSLSGPFTVFCPDYGLPQDRKRIVLFASLHGYIELGPPTHTPDGYVTLAKAIADLAPIKAGGTCNSDRLHKSSSLSPLNLKRIKVARPGGTWREWPESLRLDCHIKKSGETYPSVYGRMEWDKPAPTLTTQFYGYGNGRFGHPKQNRAISLREGAILQGFPRNYEFVPRDRTPSFRSIGRMIGNAVPVTLGQIIGESIKLHLSKVS